MFGQSFVVIYVFFNDTATTYIYTYFHSFPPPRSSGLIEVAVFQLPRIDMGLGFLAEIIAKRRRVGIHVDEHEAAESFDAHLRQRQVLEIDVREIPVAQRFLVRTVEVPGQAMEREFEFFGVAFGAGREIGRASCRERVCQYV